MRLGLSDHFQVAEMYEVLFGGCDTPTRTLHTVARDTTLYAVRRGKSALAGAL